MDQILKIGQHFENRAKFWKRGEILKMGQNFENRAKFWKWGKILKTGQNLKKWGKILKTGQKKNGCASYARQMRIKYAWILCRNPRVIYKWRVRVKCASYARQGRVNLVPESARVLQMTRTRQMRVICAAGTRECCAGIRASFTNDAYANSARGYAWFTRGQYK